MHKHREIFNQLFAASRYSAKEVSNWAGMNESRLSRFRTGKLDLEAGEFFALLACFPKEFQDSFWARLGVCGGWRSLIKSANHDDMEEILLLLAEQYSALKKQNLKTQPRESTVRDAAVATV